MRTPPPPPAQKTSALVAIPLGIWFPANGLQLTFVCSETFKIPKTVLNELLSEMNMVVQLNSNFLNRR